MEQTRNEDDAKRKKQETETPKKGGFNKQRQFHLENWPQNFLIFSVQNNRYGDDKKGVKKKYAKEIKNKRERRTMRYNKKKIHKNGDGEKD